MTAVIFKGFLVLTAPDVSLRQKYSCISWGTQAHGNLTSLAHNHRYCFICQVYKELLHPMYCNCNWCADVFWEFNSSAPERCWSNFTSLFSCDQGALWMVLSVSPSIRLSVRPSLLFHYVPVSVSSWNFQELLPLTKMMSMQKVKVRGQRSRSQRSKPNLAVSKL